MSTVLLISINGYGQNRLKCVIKDAITKEGLEGVTATITPNGRSVVSDASGTINFNIPNSGSVSISFSFVGYTSQTVDFQLPQADVNQVIGKQEH